MAMETPRSALSAAFAEQLRAERAAARLSRATLAQRSGVSAKAIQRLEDNEREMDTDQLGRLCAALGVSVLDFVTRAAHRGTGADAEMRDAQ